MVITKENISNLSTRSLEALFGKDTKKTGASKNGARGKYNKDFFTKARKGRKNAKGVSKLHKEWWKGKKKNA